MDRSIIEHLINEDAFTFGEMIKAKLDEKTKESVTNVVETLNLQEISNSLKAKYIRTAMKNIENRKNVSDRLKNVYHPLGFNDDTHNALRDTGADKDLIKTYINSRYDAQRHIGKSIDKMDNKNFNRGMSVDKAVNSIK